jgi:cobalt-zinc-cadmium efflux system outer membrane protein
VRAAPPQSSFDNQPPTSDGSVVQVADFSAATQFQVSAAAPVQPVPTFTLAEAEQIALANNPAIVAAELTANMAGGYYEQVGRPANPTIGYFGSQLANENTEQNGVFIDQEFVRGNKLDLNRAVLGHTVNAQRWEVSTQRFRVLTDVRIRFFQALAAQRQLEATEQFAEVARRGVEIAELRRQAMEGTLIEVMQSKTLLSQIDLAAEQSRAAYLGAWKDLAAVAGVPEMQPVELAGQFVVPDAAPDWQQTLGEIKAQSPELAAANALVCEKLANLKRQQVQPIPNITAQMGTAYDSATESGMINLQIGAPLPVINKNTGNISAALAEYKRAIENVRRIELAIQSRLARASQEFESAFAAVNKYEQEIVPQAEQTLELSEVSYQAGELDFLQVLVVRRVYYDSLIQLIAAQGQLAQSSAMLDGLLLAGGLDAPQDYTNGTGLRDQTFGGQ